MRFARLAVEARGRTLEVTFHPKLTVITGVGSTTRESMINELLSGLCTRRSGTHLQIVTDSGRTLVVFRPTDGPHRVIDTATGADVSSEFTSPTGSIDVLAAFGMDAAVTRRWSRIGPGDLAASTQNQSLVARLGRIDQRQLWSDAQRVQLARSALAEHDDTEPVEDVELTERIDRNYHAQDAARSQADRTRLFAIVVGIISLLGAAVTVTTDESTALAMVGVAVVATVTAFVFRARVTYYERQLTEALEQSGSESYLGYHLDRIDGYITSEQRRTHRAAVQADVDEALEHWKRTAGDVDVDWALDHRPAIEAAAGMRGASSFGASDGFDGDLALVPRHTREEAPELIEALVGRIAKSRRLGPDGESFPLLLDEPFGAFDPAVRPALLETLVGQSGLPQIVLLTNSDDIVSWAHLEALTGALSLVGPGQGSGASTPSADDARPAGPSGGSVRPPGGSDRLGTG